MRYRAAFVVGLAIGYVLGARAGRERYEQIKRVARRVADSPYVQEAAGVVQARASGLACAARHKVEERLHHRSDDLAGSLNGDRESARAAERTGPPYETR